MNENEYVLEICNISKHFPGVQALRSVSISIKAGEVHAIIGENGAGKSTLMKCLFGTNKLDDGTFRIDGEEIVFTNPAHALKYGISMVQQELDQALQLNVMENLWMGRYPCKYFFVDEKKMFADTEKILDYLKMPKIDICEKIGKMSVSIRQLIEIAKAISYDSKILVLDEPTSSLTKTEINILFNAIRKLKDDGCSIIYISHKLDEIFEICDRVSVLRDGELIITDDIQNFTLEKMIFNMVNRTLTQRFPNKDNIVGETVLKVENLSSYYSPGVENVSFDLKKGEILGVSGLMGSRRTELLETLFGFRRKGGGKVFLNGKEVDINDTKKAIKFGFSLVTEERRATGIFPVRSVSDNIIVASLRKYVNKLNILLNKRVRKATQEVIESMNVKTPTQRTLIRDLSGGNQQKVILGRWLLTDTDILLLDEPTRGIDVGAKYEIYQIIIDLAKEGKSVIFVSSEMSELLGVSDRILIMSNGRLAGIVDPKIVTQEEILQLSSKYLRNQ